MPTRGRLWRWRWTACALACACACASAGLSLPPFTLLGFFLWLGHPADFVSPETCPTWEETSARHLDPTFDVRAFQGAWEVVAHDEPTQPAFCACDSYQWKLVSPTQYTSDVTVKCLSSPWLLRGTWLGRLIEQPWHVHLEGHLSPTHRGKHLEGAPVLGANLIPLFVVWVDDPLHPRQAIVYSCSPNYLGLRVFHSLQIFARNSRDMPRAEKLALVEKAKSFGLVFNTNRHLKFTGYGDVCE